MARLTPSSTSSIRRGIAAGLLLILCSTVQAEAEDVCFGVQKVYGPVQGGETVWTIARQFQPWHHHSSMAQMVWAIHWANPKAFRGSLHKLRSGVKLAIPDYDFVLAVDRQVAWEFYIGRRDWDRSRSAHPWAQPAPPQPVGFPASLEGQTLAAAQSGLSIEERYRELAHWETSYAGDPSYDYELGKAALATGRYSEALFALRRAVQTDPQAPDPRLELEGVYLHFALRNPAAVGAQPPLWLPQLANGAPIPPALVLFASGRAEIERGAAVAPARRGAALAPGDRIATGPAGRLQLRFADGALLEVQPSSRLTIEEFNLAARRTALRLYSGGFRTVLGDLGRATTDDYRVTTPVAGIRTPAGADYSVAYCLGDCASGTPDGLYTRVYEGVITLANDYGELAVADGEDARVADVNVTPRAEKSAPVGVWAGMPAGPPGPGSSSSKADEAVPPIETAQTP